MQKIIEQDLGGNEEKAKSIVKYTWEKDEIAYYFCTAHRDVFKVQFTGERWFILGRWGNGEKIYQYKYLESSGKHYLETKADNNGISHGSEDIFYTTKEEAILIGIEFIETQKYSALETFEKDMQKILKYKNE